MPSNLDLILNGFAQAPQALQTVKQYDAQFGQASQAELDAHEAFKRIAMGEDPGVVAESQVARRQGRLSLGNPNFNQGGARPPGAPMSLGAYGGGQPAQPAAAAPYAPTIPGPYSNAYVPPQGLEENSMYQEPDPWRGAQAP